MPSLEEIYPATHNFGDYRDVLAGESPDAYYARTKLAGYGRTGEQLYQLDQERISKTEYGKYAATHMATGPLDPTVLTDDDFTYLSHCASEMTFDPRQLMHGLFFGPDVSKAGWQKYSVSVSDFPALEARVSPAVFSVVQEMALGQITFWMLAAFPELGNEQWRNEHIKSWGDGWNRLHPKTSIPPQPKPVDEGGVTVGQPPVPPQSGDAVQP